MSTKKQRMYEAITKHGNQLNSIFNTGIDSIELCKKLRRIELKQNRANENYCNGVIDTDQWEIITTRTRLNVEKILGHNIPIYINSDPRGYALKICDQIVCDKNLKIMCDWGGYGLIAPDFNQ